MNAADDEPLPECRTGEPSALQWAVLTVAVFMVAAPFTWASVASDTEGRLGLFPVWVRHALLGLFLLGCVYLVVLGLRWLIPQWIGRPLPMVEFTEERLIFRNALVPRPFVIERDQIMATWVPHVRVTRGVLPSKNVELVMTKLQNGKYRGIADHFDGTADALADDIASWAAVPRLPDEDVFDPGSRH